MHEGQNRVRAAFQAERAAIGVFVVIPSPSLVEIAGHAGFDFVILDTEHGPAGAPDVEELVRAAEVAGVTPIVRVTTGAPARILRSLDVGAQGVLVPHVVSAADARAAVSASRYPPEGTRGLSTTSRAGRYSFRPVRDHIESSNRQVLVAVQIEDAAAVAEVEAIASVPGVDILFVGPSDLSLSLGSPGQPDHPVVQEALGRVFDAAKKSRSEIGYFVRDPTAAMRVLARGARFIAFNSTLVIASAFRDLVAAVRQGMAEAMPRLPRSKASVQTRGRRVTTRGGKAAR